MATKLSITQVADIVDMEGLEHTILDCIDLNEIEDVELRKLFITAREALGKLATYLDINTIEEEQECYDGFADEYEEDEEEDWDELEEDDGG
jgi:hypothetical protein